MRSVTGQLKTWLQLQVSDSTNYPKVREMILTYDSSTTRWSEEMVLGLEGNNPDDGGPRAMEIDRLQWKGGKQNGKGKQKGKDNGKGKEKGKQSGKDQKGKTKKGHLKGKNERGSYGKGKGETRKCNTCGKPGHLAKDC